MLFGVSGLFLFFFLLLAHTLCVARFACRPGRRTWACTRTCSSTSGSGSGTAGPRGAPPRLPAQAVGATAGRGASGRTRPTCARSAGGASASPGERPGGLLQVSGGE